MYVNTCTCLFFNLDFLETKLSVTGWNKALLETKLSSLIPTPSSPELPFLAGDFLFSFSFYK